MMEHFAVYDDSTVKHSVAVTNPPPELPKKRIPWGDKYIYHARNVHNIYHAPVLINEFPMMKPPERYEHTASGQTVDVARAEFVTKMSKRKSSQ